MEERTAEIATAALEMVIAAPPETINHQKKNIMEW